MEYSKVSAVDEKMRPAVSHHYLYPPCDFFEEALRALFKCFGLDSKPWEDSSSGEEQELNEKSTENETETSLQESDSPSTQIADPSDQEVDPPNSTSETNEVAVSARVGRRPISQGSGGQIN